MDRVIRILKALADETRLKILIILSRKRICAKGIAKHLDISEAAVSQHIKVLKDAGIIIGKKTGYYVHYELQEATLREIIKLVEQITSNQAETCCKLEVHIPQECIVSCKTQGNKCCQKINN